MADIDSKHRGQVRSWLNFRPYVRKKHDRVRKRESLFGSAANNPEHKPVFDTVLKKDRASLSLGG